MSTTFGSACRLVSICAALAWGGSTSADLVEFKIVLDDDQGSTEVDSPATGTGFATLNTDTNLFTWNFSFSGLTSPQTAAHLHGPAPMCEDAAAQITLPSGSPVVGSQTVTSEQADDIVAGLWYVNVHTIAYPSGEIRGQVKPEPLGDPLGAWVSDSMIHVRLETVATGLSSPVAASSPPGDAERLFVADQDGVLWVIDLATHEKSVFLDVSDRLVELGFFGPGSWDERGLLGFAFHPDYFWNGKLYTCTSEPPKAEPDYSTIPEGAFADHQSVILEWQVPDPGNPDAVVDPGSVRELLRIDQPQFNHNLACLAFGPDGLLYIGSGDGGGIEDHDGQFIWGATMIGHGCGGNGQNINNPHGKVLRIDVDGTDGPNGQYGIPADNPFVGAAGLDEIYAYGFRNPWRFSFDALSGDLYIADAGENFLEEINLGFPGGNYGWHLKEGSFFHVANGNLISYITDVPQDVPGDLIDPMKQYDHSDGGAIIGGFVYRGAKIPPLHGLYVFGDYNRAGSGILYFLEPDDDMKRFKLLDQPTLGFFLYGLCVDDRGELYAMGNNTLAPFGDTGKVVKITTRSGDIDASGVVGLSDLLAVLSAWGPCAGCAEDINDDGSVGFADLVIILSNWG